MPVGVGELQGPPRLLDLLHCSGAAADEVELM